MKLFKDLTKEIKEAKNIVIWRHVNPDCDTAGAAFGLKEIIKDNFGKTVKVGSTERNDLIDRIFPADDKVGEKFLQEALHISVDTANIDRIDGQPRMDNMIKVDHHPNNEKFGRLMLVEPKSSSTCELITEWASKEKLKISKLAAKYLFAGMVTDTGRFQYSSTTSKTLEMASILLKEDFALQGLYSKLYERSINYVKFGAYVQSGMKVNDNVASFILPKNKEKKFDISYSSASSSVFLLMGSKEVKYGMFASYDKENKIWKVSLRSKGKPVSPICELFGGGGHSAACGIKVDKSELSNILEELKRL